MNRRQRRLKETKDHNNRKGHCRVLVVGVTKFRRRKQFIGNKMIIHYDSK